MLEFKFKHGENEFILGDSNFSYIDNDEVEGIDLEGILTILNEAFDMVDFDYEYFSDSCEECGGGKNVEKKYYGFLEYHFYIFTKNGKYVISNISKEFENTSYTKLIKENKIDNSYIVSILLCEDCKNYNIAIEQCDM